jgi:hypothetical protein
LLDLLADSCNLGRKILHTEKPRSAKENYTPIGVIVVVVVVVMVITNDVLAPMVVVANIVDMLCKFSIS